MIAVPVLIVVALVALGALASVRILKQYERGVQFRLGRVEDEARGPGVIFIIPLIDHVHRVSLRIVTMPIQSQGIITRDNVSVTNQPLVIRGDVKGNIRAVNSRVTLMPGARVEGDFTLVGGSLTDALNARDAPA